MSTSKGIQRIFRSIPGLFLVLKPDFTILAISDDLRPDACPALRRLPARAPRWVLRGALLVTDPVLEINKVALDGVGIRLSDVEGRRFWDTFCWQVTRAINQGIREAGLSSSRARQASCEFEAHH